MARTYAECLEYFQGMLQDMTSKATAMRVPIPGATIDQLMAHVFNEPELAFTKIPEVPLNLLSYNQSTVEEGTEGFLAIGGTLTQDLTEFWEGLASLKVVSGNVGSGEGFGLDLSALAIPQHTMTLSLYAKGSGTLNLHFDDDESYSLNIPIELTNEWVRYQIYGEVPVGATAFYFTLATDSQQEVTFYVDGLQFEDSLPAGWWLPGGIAPAVASDMSLGKAAFVNGELLIGTSAGGGGITEEQLEEINTLLEIEPPVSDIPETIDALSALLDAFDILIGGLPS